MEAGLSLLEEVKRHNAETPVLLQSASVEDSPAALKAKELGARYVCKESPALLHELQVRSLPCSGTVTPDCPSARTAHAASAHAVSLLPSVRRSSCATTC